MAESPTHDEDVQITKGSRLAVLLEQEEIAANDLQGLNNASNLIGSGAFGEVRLVTWRKTPAAAKVAHRTMPKEQKQLFLRELECMVRCRHPNIVQFLGYVDSPFVIVMEYLANGDLRSYWRSHKVSNGHKVQICIDVLRALAYLHNRKPSSIIHRDIKPTNVLMTKSGVAKLTDFGLGRLMGQDNSKHSGTGSDAQDVYAAPEVTFNESVHKGRMLSPLKDATAFTGTAPYMAPESNTAMYDSKVDIYSAAVTFYELFEQANFDPEMPFAWGVTPKQVSVLVKKMGDSNPAKRPGAIELIDMFVDTKMAKYPKDASGCCSVS